VTGQRARPCLTSLRVVALIISAVVLVGIGSAAAYVWLTHEEDDASEMEAPWGPLSVQVSDVYLTCWSQGLTWINANGSYPDSRSPWAYRFCAVELWSGDDAVKWYLGHDELGSGQATVQNFGYGKPVPWDASPHSAENLSAILFVADMQGNGSLDYGDFFGITMSLSTPLAGNTEYRIMLEYTSGVWYFNKVLSFEFDGDELKVEDLTHYGVILSQPC